MKVICSAGNCKMQKKMERKKTMHSEDLKVDMLDYLNSFESSSDMLKVEIDLVW